jgi:hypothetical protein
VASWVSRPNRGRSERAPGSRRRAPGPACDPRCVQSRAFARFYGSGWSTSGMILESSTAAVR